LSLALAAAVAHAAGDSEPPEMSAERDRLIERITRGIDSDAAVRRFGELLKERDRISAVSVGAQERAQAAAARRRQLHEAVAKSPEYHVGRHCRMSMDPRRAPFERHAWDEEWVDWGRVTRREEVKLPPINALAEDEHVRMYEIAGQRRRYRIADEQRALDAAVGSWVLVCATREADHDPSYRKSREVFDGPSVEDRLPPEWRGIDHHRPNVWAIAAPPRIPDKLRWDPIHLSSNDLWWAIKDVKWKVPADRHAVTYAEVIADLGAGRYEIDAERELTWILEVPPGLRAPKLGPGAAVWAIVGPARFDRSLKKLVLTAVDLEEHYFVAR
jgi:hypothetical protein